MLIWTIVILVIVVVGLMILFLFWEKFNKDNSHKKVENSATPNLLARFSFNNEEWEYVNQREFVEDEKGKKFFDNYISVISYGNILWKDIQQEILFTPQEIYLTNGIKAKSFKVNKLNSFGNGVHLTSIDLLHLLPLKKLRIKVTVDSVNDNLNKIDSDLEYLVPIPHSSLEKIDEVLKNYGDIILKN